MKRREFISLLGGAAAWPLAARAQQAKLRTIGFFGSATASSQGHWATAFVTRLRELGWVDGRDLAIVYRWAEGRNDRYAEIADEFVRLKVDVILTSGTPSAIAVKQATLVIPIVVAASDPVSTGLVASLNRPGGNVTGLSSQLADTTGKRFELLREVLPTLSGLRIMLNPDAASAVLELHELQAKASAFGVETETFEIRQTQDIARAFQALKGLADALYVCIDPLLTNHRVRISTLAAVAQLPTV